MRNRPLVRLLALVATYLVFSRFHSYDSCHSYYSCLLLLAPTSPLLCVPMHCRFTLIHFGSLLRSLLCASPHSHLLYPSPPDTSPSTLICSRSTLDSPSTWERKVEVNGAVIENEQICSFSVPAPFTSASRSHMLPFHHGSPPFNPIHPNSLLPFTPNHISIHSHMLPLIPIHSYHPLLVTFPSTLMRSHSSPFTPTIDSHMLPFISVHSSHPLPVTFPSTLTYSRSPPFTSTIDSQSCLCSLQFPLVHLRALLCAPVYYPTTFNLFPFLSNCFFRSVPSASPFIPNCFSVHSNSAPSTFLHSYAPSSSLPFTLMCSRSLPLTPDTHSLLLLPFTFNYSWVFPICHSVQSHLLSRSLKSSLACFSALLRTPTRSPSHSRSLPSSSSKREI